MNIFAAMFKKMMILLSFTFVVSSSFSQIIANFQLNSLAFCGTTSVLTMLDVSAGTVATRTWTVNGPGGFTSFSRTNVSETVVLTQLGSYSVSLEVCDALGACETKDTTITAFANPTAVINATDTIACFGTSVIFNSFSSTAVTPGLQSYWDNDYNTGIDDNSTSFTFLANSDIIVMLYVEDDHGCVDTAFQNLFIVQNEDAFFELENQCAGVPFDLTTTSTVSNSSLDSIYWLVNTVNVLIGEVQTYTHPVEDSIPVILYVINNYGCSDGYIRYIKIDAQIDLVTNITDTTICEGETVMLQASGAYSYEWPDGSTEDTLSVSPSVSATYSVLGASETGACESDEIDINVNVINAPEMTFETPTFNPVIGVPVEIKVVHDPQFSIKDSLLWLDHGTTNVLENTIGFENGFEAKESVSFPVSLVFYKDGRRCVTDSVINFVIDDECSNENIFMTNVFTPNHDLQNDIFRISGYTIEQVLEFVVFNRAGQVVFNETNIGMINGTSEKGWDGNNSKNVRCSNGVYTYYYKAMCRNGADVEGSGNVTLVR